MGATDMSKLYPCKESISTPEYYQVMGLLMLAKQHVASLADIEKALRSITGDVTEHGHCGDACYGDYTADHLLDLLDIRVGDPLP